MKYLLATLRLLLLCGVTLGYYFRWLLGLPFVFAVPKWSRCWREQNVGHWARATSEILGMRVNVRNTPPVAPFLLVSNHLSYVDIVALQSQVDCVFIAKREVASWPLLGFVCRTLGTIFIDRTNKRDLLSALARVEASLDRGSGVVLFAEGTSSAGREILPFRPSLLECAARRHLPVHYASIKYTGPPDAVQIEQSICWWGNMTFPGHLFRLLQLNHFEARLAFGSEPIVGDDRRVLADRLWAAVNRQFHDPTATAELYETNHAATIPSH